MTSNHNKVIQQLIYNNTVPECFSTGVPQNLRVPPLVSKGSMGPPVLSKKLNCIRHLRPLDAFSRLLIGPKCICGRGSAPNPAGEAYSAPPDSLAGGALWFHFTEKVEKPFCTTCMHCTWPMTRFLRLWLSFQ